MKLLSELYVVVYNTYGKPNATLDQLKDNDVRTLDEVKEQGISLDQTDGSELVAITLKEWGSENYDSGYVDAYG